MDSTHVKNLGVIFDNTFNFYRQLSHMTKLLNYQLHSIRLIRHSIFYFFFKGPKYYNNIMSNNILKSENIHNIHKLKKVLKNYFLNKY